MSRKRQPTWSDISRQANSYGHLEALLRLQAPAPTPTLLADQSLAVLAVARYREALEQYLATLPGDPYAEQPKPKRTRKAKANGSPGMAFDQQAEQMAEQEDA